MDRFRINHVQFSLRNRSMNFSLTFEDLKSNGSYDGIGNFIKYIPIKGKGNYNFDAYSNEPKEKSFRCLTARLSNFLSDFTTNIVAYVTFKRLRMQITNFTATSAMSRFKV